MAISKNKNIFQEAIDRRLELETRRHFLRQCATGLGAMGMSSLLGPSSLFGDDKIIRDSANPLAVLAPPYAAKAKSVIFLHMAGAPSQLEMFDYKPELAKLDGQLCPPSLIEGKQFPFIQGVPKMLGPQYKFRQFGESGKWMSELLPNLSGVVDDLTFVHSMQTDQFNHAPAQLLIHTGGPRLGRPSMGSWVTYGLGTDNQDLPGFVVLLSGGVQPDAGRSVFGSGFLPSVYQGVQCRSEGDPVLYASNPEGVSRSMRRKAIYAINEINAKQYEEIGDPEILTRISQYELAYRMQMSVPEVMDISKEPDYIQEMYGVEPGKTSLANNCLLARRLVEQGVRFVQIFDWGWDAHGAGASEGLLTGFKKKCGELDQPVAALIKDLKQRGLLEDTIVVWGGEFGRTPMLENRSGQDNPFVGRDHHTDCFTWFVAGGGFEPGISYGETDPIGYSVTKNPVHVHDMQATILHQLGFDHEKFTYKFQGRDYRLTDVSGKVVKGLLA